MESFILTEEEIQDIKQFLEEAKNIPVVECVYLVAYLDKNHQEKKVKIILIANPIGYFKAVHPKAPYSVAELSRAWDLVGEICERFNEKLAYTRLSSEIESSDNYSLSLMHRRELMAEMAIASGTIIFDRDGNMIKNQNSAKGYFDPLEDVLPIGNLEELLGEAPKK